MADTHILANIHIFSPTIKCISVSKSDSKMSLAFLTDGVCLHVCGCFVLIAVSVSLVLLFSSAV